ncbi:hypothetical protein LZ30DRAFT_296762 [Colletotrichum cereale]|nr:hypothetical protein LZ30DRAFT_296762 [Colletotrichum cereale]
MNVTIRVASTWPLLRRGRSVPPMAHATNVCAAYKLIIIIIIIPRCSCCEHYLCVPAGFWLEPLLNINPCTFRTASCSFSHALPIDNSNPAIPPTGSGQIRHTCRHPCSEICYSTDTGDMPTCGRECEKEINDWTLSLGRNPILSFLSLTDAMIVPHPTLPILSHRIGSPQASEGSLNDLLPSRWRCNVAISISTHTSVCPLRQLANGKRPTTASNGIGSEPSGGAGFMKKRVCSSTVSEGVARGLGLEFLARQRGLVAITSSPSILSGELICLDIRTSPS